MTSKTSDTTKETFDYVIVGAGAAGAILANRLSADPSVTVCVLEAGGHDRSPLLHIPSGFIKVIFNPAYAWQFSSRATEQTAGRNVPIPQGKVLGGTTSINGMIYNRGQAEDYDLWANAGNSGWSYAEVLPYFKRMEACASEIGENRFHGRDGCLPITGLDWIHPICEAFIHGATNKGLPRNPDYNGATQEGVGYFQRTIKGRWRMSTASTFLRPAKSRPNLFIKTHAHAVAVLLEGKSAVGIRYLYRQNTAQPLEVHARKEVIICSGAINTPKLMQLSGIGPAPLLASLGIPLRHELPGVGENLRDHFSVRLVARVRNSLTINEMVNGLGLMKQIGRWLLGKPNILAVSPSLVHWFAKSDKALTRPDLQGVFSPASYKEGYVGLLDNFPGMTVGVWGHRPFSVGYVHAQSSDPLQEPLVQANYLADARDREVLLSGMRQARELLRTAELAGYFESEAMPGESVTSDQALLDYARRYGVSACHLIGTSRMGPKEDPMAVVDDRLCVHGLQGLRIVDASIMPSTPSANTCAATMMIAEKASDMIRGKAPMEPIFTREPLTQQKSDAGAAYAEVDR